VEEQFVATAQLPLLDLDFFAPLCGMGSSEFPEWRAQPCRQLLLIAGNGSSNARPSVLAAGGKPAGLTAQWRADQEAASVVVLSAGD
jgi:hypothetical protein